MHLSTCMIMGQVPRVPVRRKGPELPQTMRDPQAQIMRPSLHTPKVAAPGPKHHMWTMADKVLFCPVKSANGTYQIIWLTCSICCVGIRFKEKPRYSLTQTL